MTQINIIDLLNIQNVFFTVIGYEMSYIEFFGTILNVISVYLVAKNKLWNWPIGIVASILFMFLFWQIQLYSDFAEQIYYIVTGFWGWYAWSISKKINASKDVTGDTLKISYLNKREKINLGVITIILTSLLSFFTANADKLFPNIFTQPASYVVLDAFTTVLSFVATYLLIHKKIESWYIWIFVDLIAIWLYYVKDVRFISILYIIFLVLATRGLINWYKIYSNEKQNQ